jgi:outer membrane autotransporter protein
MWSGAIGFYALTSPAEAGCAFAVIGGGQQVDCAATTAPDPTVSPVSIPSGANVLNIFSGSYNSFGISGGNNTITVSGGTLSGGVVTGIGNDKLTMKAGTIGGDIDQGDGTDTFTMSGGTIASLQQGGGLDTFLMTGGTIIGAFKEGDFITITGGSIGSVDMTIANNIFTMSGGSVVGDVVASFQNDTFTLTGGNIGGSVNLGRGTNKLTVSGGTIGSGIVTDTGTDTLVWNGGIIKNAIALGGGDDQATLENLNSTNLAGTTAIDGGAGTDHLAFANTEISGVDRIQNWESVDLTNGTRMTLDHDLTLGDSATQTGTLTIDGTSTLLAGDSNNSILAFSAGSLVNVANGGRIDLSNGSNSVNDTLTIGGNYDGQGGSLHVNTVLGTDGSPSDRLIISSGDASGSTSVQVTNVGGGGAITSGNGILVVDTTNGGTTHANAFGLAGPVSAGPYAYTLHRSSLDATNSEAWYLRSTIDCALQPSSPACVVAPSSSGPEPQAPNYRRETSLYTALPAVTLLYGKALIDTLHERSGDSSAGNDKGGWGRIAYLHGDQDSSLGIFGDGPAYNYDFGFVQAGQDLYRAIGTDGSHQNAGAYLAFGTGQSDVTHFDGNSAGRDTFDASTLGGYWTYFDASGSYVDAVVQGTWYEEKADAIAAPGLKTGGPGFAGSLEGGHPFSLGGGWVIEPQAQAVLQSVSLRDTSDGAASIEFRDVESFAGRIGVRLANTWLPSNSNGRGAVTFWVRPSIWEEFLGVPVTTFSSEGGPVPFHADLGGSWLDLTAGVTAKVSDTVSFFGNGSYQQGLDGDSQAYGVNLGLRLDW